MHCDIETSKAAEKDLHIHDRKSVRGMDFQMKSTV